MIYTQKEMAQATTSFESRFRMAYLSVNFNPTIVVACHSKLLLTNTYRGMVIKRHIWVVPLQARLPWTLWQGASPIFWPSQTIFRTWLWIA